MSTITIGDIHGNFKVLDNLLNKITPVICPADTVVFLGDYIDRGPATKDCMDRILYGHSGNPVIDKKGWPLPRIVNRTNGLDTIHTGVLTAFKLPEKIVIQSDRFN
jgi:hypothetical protein